ncbi:leucine-rich repeat domain-containing protein [Veronia pacifica]|uniref:Leucine-rich repeat domain-containing protein n=1 Tax=Veronia pacifica TaxID=1080227 RepID=A0A1C3EIK0_9GAMM|nr:leucine-rich repeat domain-containing protein [Veronia pacifica]ODA33057.1 hypothetical protein A8L45_11465 [Veronia pacifica]
MKHHFGDFLDRDYWTVVSNRERYAYAIGDVPAGSKEITIVTIGSDDENWERIFTLPNLEELTLYEPTKEQLQSISKLTVLKRLRITHARPKDIDFISSLVNIEELVLEYVSGFSDLSPLQSLTKLRSLHMENLRRVKEFDGLAGIESLRYLRIDGTLDWKQPISDFNFLKGLPNLEVLSFGQIINKSSYPALLPVLALEKLKKIKLTWNMLAAEEYALMEVALPNVDGADWGPFTRFSYSSIPLPRDDVRAHLPEDVIKSNHPEVSISYKGERLINDPKEEWFEFTGKKAGRAKCNNSKSKEKCDEYSKKYQLMKEEAHKVISSIKQLSG